MRVKYCGPLDEVELVGVGTVQRGEVLNVPKELLGRAPGYVTQMVAQVELDEDGTARLVEADAEVWDPGEGLLGQPENWEPAEARPRRTSATNHDSTEEGVN